MLVSKTMRLRFDSVLARQIFACVSTVVGV